MVCLCCWLISPLPDRMLYQEGGSTPALWHSALEGLCVPSSRPWSFSPRIPPSFSLPAPLTLRPVAPKSDLLVHSLPEVIWGGQQLWVDQATWPGQFGVKIPLRSHRCTGLGTHFQTPSSRKEALGGIVRGPSLLCSTDPWSCCVALFPASVAACWMAGVYFGFVFFLLLLE